MPGFFSKLLSPPCKQKDISSEQTPNVLTRALADSLPSCSTTLWVTGEAGKYGSMEVTSIFKHILCCFLHFFGTLHDSRLVHLQKVRKGAKVMWENEAAMAGTILVPEAHENLWFHYALLICSCSPWHPQREEGREKGEQEHPQKTW